MIENKVTTAVSQSILNTFLFLLAGTMFFPFIYIFCVSFTDATVYHAGTLAFWPEKWSTAAYRYVFSGHGFTNALRSTLFIAFIGTPLNVVVNAGMAYMLSKNGLPGKGIMLKLVLFTMLFSPGLIPNYLVIRQLHLIDSLWSLILPGAAGAWTLLVMKSFFQNIPSELQEAAIVDGANDIQIFFRVILPLSKAMLATFTLFAAVSFWNTYFSALIYLNSSTKWPLQVFLQQIVMSANVSEFLSGSTLDVKEDRPPQEIIKMATVIVAVVPILIVYPFLQKHFAKGVMIGSVKG